MSHSLLYTLSIVLQGMASNNACWVPCLLFTGPLVMYYRSIVLTVDYLDDWPCNIDAKYLEITNNSWTPIINTWPVVMYYTLLHYKAMCKSIWHDGSSGILNAGQLLLYLTWPLPFTLLRVYRQKMNVPLIANLRSLKAIPFCMIDSSTAYHVTGSTEKVKMSIQVWIL